MTDKQLALLLTEIARRLEDLAEADGTDAPLLTRRFDRVFDTPLEVTRSQLAWDVLDFARQMLDDAAKLRE